MVNNTETTLESHMDCHIMLSNSVHGRGNEWGLEGNAFRDWGVEDDFRGRKANVAGQNEEVIVGQTAMFLGVKQAGNVKTIAFFVLLQDFEGLLVVQGLTEEGRRRRGGSITIWLRYL